MSIDDFSKSDVAGQVKIVEKIVSLGNKDHAVQLVNTMTVDQVKNLIKNGCELSLIQRCMEMAIGQGGINVGQDHVILSAAIDAKRSLKSYPIVAFFCRLFGKSTAVDKASGLLQERYNQIEKVMQGDGPLALIHTREHLLKVPRSVVGNFSSSPWRMSREFAQLDQECRKGLDQLFAQPNNAAEGGSEVTIVCDAIPGSGLEGVNAAKKFSLMMSNYLTYFPSVFEEASEKEIASLFQCIAEYEPMKEGAYVFTGREGVATMSVATFQKTDEGLKVVGASLGDTVVLHVDVQKGKAYQLNQKTEGQLRRGHGLNGTVSSFTKDVGDNDLIINASSGLIDNLDAKELQDQIPLIIRCSKFDSIPQERCPWTSLENPHVVTTDDLKQFTGDTLQDYVAVTSEVAAERLENYLMWVKKDHEQFPQKLREETRLKMAQLEEKKNQELNALYLPHELEQEIRRMKEEKGQKFLELERKRQQLVQQHPEVIEAIVKKAELQAQAIEGGTPEEKDIERKRKKEAIDECDQVLRRNSEVVKAYEGFQREEDSIHSDYGHNPSEMESCAKRNLNKAEAKEIQDRYRKQEDDLNTKQKAKMEAFNKAVKINNTLVRITSPNSKKS